jgi:hypothetical protein
MCFNCSLELSAIGADSSAPNKLHCSLLFSPKTDNSLSALLCTQLSATLQLVKSVFLYALSDYFIVHTFLMRYNASI